MKTKKILALALLVCLFVGVGLVAIPIDAIADMAAGMTGLSGLDLQPSNSSQTNSLVVRNSSGTAKLTISTAGAVDMQGVLSLDNEETIDNTNDDFIEFQGVSGTDNTDCRLDLDGTYPVWSSPTDTVIGFAETIALASGDQIINAPADYIMFQCAGACTAAQDVTFDLDDATAPIIYSDNASQIQINDILEVNADILLQSGDTIDNNAADVIALQCSGACADATDIAFDVDGTRPIIYSVTDTTVEINDILEVQGDILLESGDTLDNAAPDVVAIQCSGACADATDLAVDVDGTRPVLYSVTDTEVEVSDALIASGGMTLTCAGCITGTNIADKTTSRPIGLYEWRTSAAGAPLDIVAATTPNTATEGSFETIEWATGEQANKIETTFTVPSNYKSTPVLNVWTAHDAAAANNAETLSCSWYTVAAGGADNPGAADEGAIAMTNAETVSLTSIPLDAAATIAAGQPLRVVLGFTAIDQTVHLIATQFSYVSDQ